MVKTNLLFLEIWRRSENIWTIDKPGDHYCMNNYRNIHLTKQRDFSSNMFKFYNSLFLFHPVLRHYRYVERFFLPPSRLLRWYISSNRASKHMTRESFVIVNHKHKLPLIVPSNFSFLLTQKVHPLFSYLQLTITMNDSGHIITDS